MSPDMLQPVVLVGGARQRAPVTRLNRLIQVDFCLSPTDDSKRSSEKKVIQRGWRGLPASVQPGDSSKVLDTLTASGDFVAKRTKGSLRSPSVC